MKVLSLTPSGVGLFILWVTRYIMQGAGAVTNKKGLCYERLCEEVLLVASLEENTRRIR